MEQNYLILIAVTVLSVSGVNAYQLGAPPAVCISQHTSHDGHEHQRSECPFKLTFSSTHYVPGQELNVTLASLDKAEFRGFIIYAHRTVGNLERPVGEMTSFPADKAQFVPCAFDQNVGISHANGAPVTSMTFTWRAPDINVGDIVFKYMVVANFETFWIGLQSERLLASEPLNETPAVEKESLMTSELDFSTCGVSKGCFLYPRFCTGSDCSAAVTYTPQGDEFVIEMFVSQREYIALGFSHNQLMEGNDHVHACTGVENQLTVQNGVNPYSYYSRTYKTGFKDMEVATIDGKTMCRFRRPRSMEVYSVELGRSHFDLNKEYYLYLAWGALYRGTDVISYHTEAPVVSASPVNFNRMDVIKGSSLPVLTQVHGTLMLIAWVLLCGLVTVISRYYQNLKGDSQLCGTKYWFQIHRWCGVLVWMLTAAAFVIIFVKVKALSKRAPYHAYVGIAVMAACTLQVILGLARPSADSKLRPAFNLVHWGLGKSTHILAVVTVFLVYYADATPAKQREFGVIVTSVWLALQVVWELALEARKCQQARRSGREYQISNDVKPTDKPSSTSGFDICLLVIYFITLLGVLTAQLLAIYLF